MKSVLTGVGLPWRLAGSALGRMVRKHRSSWRSLNRSTTKGRTPILQCVPSRLLPANYVAGIVISETQLSLAFILDAPPFLTGLYGLLIGAAPYMGLGCFVAAAVSFRSGGGANFEIGRRFSPTGYSGAWCSWLFRQFHCFLKSGWHSVATSRKLLSSRRHTSLAWLNLVQYFTNNYLVSHLVPVVAAALYSKALLDSAEGNTPIPSLVSALLVFFQFQALWRRMPTPETYLGPVRRGQWPD